MDTTGKKTEKDKTDGTIVSSLTNKRKLRLDTSLGGRDSQSAPASPIRNGYLSFTWEEEKNCSVKKPKTEGSSAVEAGGETFAPGTRLAAKIIGTIKALDREIRIIGEAAKGNTNTKREIKESALNLRSMMSQIMTAEAQAVLRTMGGTTSANESIIAIEDDDDIVVRKQLEELETENKHLEGENERLRGRHRELEELENIKSENKTLKNRVKELEKKLEKYDVNLKIKATLEREKTPQALEEIIDAPWEAAVFSNTIQSHENPLIINKENDLAIAREAGEDYKPSPIYNKYIERYPELQGINTGKDGSSTAMVSSCRVIRGEDIASSERYIYLIEARDFATAYEAINNTKIIMERYGRTKMAMPRIDCLSLEHTKKIIEYIFHGSNVVVTICHPKPSSLTGGANTKGRRNDAIIVEAQDEDYASMLKKIKEEIRKNQGDTELRALRKTKNGNILIELNKGDRGKTKTLAESLQKNVDGLKTRVAAARSGDSRKLQVRDLDILTTEEEILKGIEEAFPDVSKNVRVVSLREAAGGCQTALIETSQTIAESLLNAGYLKIGIVRCRIREWVQYTKCFRCWEPGHVATDCTGEDRSKLCRRCGKPEHETRSCHEATYCPLCQRQGHRAGSAGCKKVAGILKEARQKAKKQW